MNKEKIAAITRNIEAEFEMLEELTGSDYITATRVNGGFMMWCNENENNEKLIDVFTKGENE